MRGGFGGSLLFLFLLRFLLHTGDGGGIDGCYDAWGDGGADAAAGIPAGARAEAYRGAAVVGALGDVVEGGGCFGGVDGGLGEAGGFAVLLIGERDEAGPERSYGAGAADDIVAAVDADLIAGGRVGVAGDVWDTASAGGVDGCGDTGVGLPGW